MGLLARSWRAAATAASLAAAGCANQPMGEFRKDDCFSGYIDEVKLERELAAAKPCCNSLAELPFMPPEPNGKLQATRASPSFDFASGRSRVIALDLRQYPSNVVFLMPLPAGATAPADATCQSRMSGEIAHRHGMRAFIPSVTWLDAAKRELRTDPSGQVTLLGRGDAQTPGWRFDRPAQAQYAVIYSDPRHHGTAVVLDAPRYYQWLAFSTGGVPLAIPVSAGGPRKLISSSTGSFQPVLWRLIRPSTNHCAASPAPPECSGDEIRTTEQMIGPERR